MIRLLDVFPIWGVGLFTLLLSLLSFEIGRRIARRAGRDEDASLGTMVGAGLGLLAFFLAFTFGIAASQFEKRRSLLLEEANAIGTAYLRTDLVSEPARSDVRRLLREYTEVRIKGAETGRIEAAIDRSVELQELFWAQAAAAGSSDPHSIAAGLLIESLNEVIDLHQMRVTIGRMRIPGRVWDVLFLLMVTSMLAMGYHSGGKDTSRSPVVLLLVAAFSIVIFIIADLDRPLEGSLRVSQQALIDTLEGMDPP
jgi:hypothetical protein